MRLAIKGGNTVDIWVGGVIGTAYHKLQIASCASAKNTLNEIYA